MSQEAEPGFILHAREYRENSRLLEVFSLNYGRLTLMARLGKKTVKPQALLQPFCPLRLSFVKGRGEIYQLRGFNRAGAALQLQVPQIFCAAYVNELLYYLLKPADPSPALFASYLSTLRALEGRTESDSAAESALRDFELQLLSHLGFGLDLQALAALDPAALYSFSLSAGFMRQDHEAASDLTLYPGALLRRLALAAEAGTVKERELLLCLKQLNRSALQQLLGRRQLKSRQLYLDYLNIHSR